MELADRYNRENNAVKEPHLTRKDRLSVDILAKHKNRMSDMMDKGRNSYFASPDRESLISETEMGSRFN